MKLSDFGQVKSMPVAAATAVVQFDDIPATTLARSRDTVDLDARPWPLYVLWAAVLGLGFYALKPKGRPSDGPDALDVLRRESWR